ncbi:hypothetical protein EVJ58_g9005 [Rhodofomes roseus]|uniref:Putative ER transporter 6TM N-terminal domain-containing protein n=1 Tax=Rhodofomes roseus TaxID=34475 RepID=A0A4Y9XVL4_9APHY|nr:hypothetical protein EVJ58_g9005 [Rhodofomes roseus]
MAFFLFIKAKKGPGPYAFPSVFGTITIDISFVTAVLFPYPYYTIGKVVVLPLVLHASLCILASATIFASTIIAQYASALARSLELVLESAIREHRSIFKLSPSGSDFSATAKKISRLVTRAGGGLGLAAAAPRLVKSDIAFGRFAPSDVGRVQEFGRGLIVRANGLDIFPLIDLTRERFPVTPLPSNPPVSSRRQSSHPGTTAIGRASVVIEMVRRTMTLTLHTALTWAALDRRNYIARGEQGEATLEMYMEMYKSWTCTRTCTSSCVGHVQVQRLYK